MRNELPRVERYAGALSRKTLLYQRARCPRIVMASWRVDYLGKKGERLGIVEARDQSKAIEKTAEEFEFPPARLQAHCARNPTSQEIMPSLAAVAYRRESLLTMHPCNKRSGCKEVNRSTNLTTSATRSARVFISSQNGPSMVYLDRPPQISLLLEEHR